MHLDVDFLSQMVYGDEPTVHVGVLRIEAERQRAKDGVMLSIGAIREAVTEVVVFMLFALGERFASRAAAFIRDPPKL